MNSLSFPKDRVKSNALTVNVFSANENSPRFRKPEHGDYALAHFNFDSEDSGWTPVIYAKPSEAWLLYADFDICDDVTDYVLVETNFWDEDAFLQEPDDEI
jgi:hypothetical protein